MNAVLNMRNVPGDLNCSYNLSAEDDGEIDVIANSLAALEIPHSLIFNINDLAGVEDLKQSAVLRVQRRIDLQQIFTQSPLIVFPVLLLCIARIETLLSNDSTTVTEST